MDSFDKLLLRDGSPLTETEETVFKVPQRRRRPTHFPAQVKIMKTRLFMAEGGFTAKEGYRLKKVLTRLNVLLAANDNSSQVSVPV